MEIKSVDFSKVSFDFLTREMSVLDTVFTNSLESLEHKCRMIMSGDVNSTSKSIFKHICEQFYESYNLYKKINNSKFVMNDFANFENIYILPLKERGF